MHTVGLTALWEVRQWQLATTLAVNLRLWNKKLENCIPLGRLAGLPSMQSYINTILFQRC